MSVKLASAEQPSDPGSTGSKWAAEEQLGFRSSTLSLKCQFGIRLMFLAIPVLVYVSGCVEGNFKNVTWYAALNR